METTSMGIWIPMELWNNEDLPIIEKIFIVKIQALDGEKGCYASNRYFSEFFKLSKSRCSAVIKSLKDKGYIAIDYVYEEGKNAIERRIIKIKKAVNKIDINIDMNKNKTNEKKNNNNIICEEVIGYLNMKYNTNFKCTTKKTIGCINARIREGNTLDDFKKVIDKKYEEWSNTDMSIYLRPETLFGIKFERYLTEDVKVKRNHSNANQVKNVRRGGENEF